MRMKHPLTLTLSHRGAREILGEDEDENPWSDTLVNVAPFNL